MNKSTMNSNKRFTRTQITQTIKVLVFVFALIVAFLFALNGRYMKVSDYELFDKWTKTIILIEKLEIIE